MPYLLNWHHLIFVALPILALTMLVQLILKATYSRYSKIANRHRVTGAEAARRILEMTGIHDVRVEEVGGFLSDHYDPTHKVLRLSPGNYRSTSIAAVGVAAHEAGHAVQHARNYAPLALRNMAVPAANLGSGLGYVVIMIGLLMANPTLAMIGVVLIGGIVVFQLVNLPVEFDASKRALELLPESGILSPDELGGARKVLGAAALTYVAATIAAIWELVYWLMYLGILGGDE